LFPAPPDGLNLADVEALPPRPHRARHEMRRQLCGLSQHRHLDVRRHPKCGAFQEPGRRPSHLQSLSVGWHGHRHRFEHGGLEHFQNAVDQNFPKDDSGGLPLIDPKNLTVDLIPSETAPRTESEVRLNETKSQSGGPSLLGSTTNHQMIEMNRRWTRYYLVTACHRRTAGLSCQILIGSMDGPSRAQLNPMPIRPWIPPSNHPLPAPTSLLDDRRPGGRWTYPSATNWKKEDWPYVQPTGPRPHL